MDKDYTFYIVFRKDTDSNHKHETCRIRNTKNNMDTVSGLKAEIAELEESYGCYVFILNWKRLER
jgi:hypothetical protein